jgi:hypothetical protein
VLEASFNPLLLVFVNWMGIACLLLEDGGQTDGLLLGLLAASVLEASELELEVGPAGLGEVALPVLFLPV